jgi:hypothetical protein
MAAWSCGNVSVCGDMGSEIESCYRVVTFCKKIRHGIGCRQKLIKLIYFLKYVFKKTLTRKLQDTAALKKLNDKIANDVARVYAVQVQSDKNDGAVDVVKVIFGLFYP